MANSTPTGLSLDSFLSLLRSKPDSLDAYLGQVGAKLTLPSTKAQVHCYFLKYDGNKLPRVSALAKRLACELVNYSIPRSKIMNAMSSADGETDTKHIIKLHQQATSLFTDLVKTGEGGEMLLYLMTETFLRAPQLLCKMPLKTSSNLHYNGADGVHGTYDKDTGGLAVYWGESKLHGDVVRAIGSCFDSLAPFLLPDGSSSSPQLRDLELLTDNIDLGDPDLEKALLRHLDPDDVLFNKLSYRGVALVGFDSECYTSPTLLTEQCLSAALESAADKWHQSVSYHVGKHKLSQIVIELFCLPFPSVEAFRAYFLKELGLA